MCQCAKILATESRRYNLTKHALSEGEGSPCGDSADEGRLRDVVGAVSTAALSVLPRATGDGHSNLRNSMSQCAKVVDDQLPMICAPALFRYTWRYYQLWHRQSLFL